MEQVKTSWYKFLLGHTAVSITINNYTDIFDKYKLDEFNKYLEYKRANNF